MGGLVHFPRTGARRGDAEWHDTAETSSNARPSTRTPHDASLITWIDAKCLRDGDDDGDGGTAA